jgi:hypothetical protein
VEHTEVHPKINCVGYDQEAKQTKTLQHLAFSTVPRFAHILPHIESIVAAMSSPRQDAERSQAIVTEVIRVAQECVHQLPEIFFQLIVHDPIGARSGNQAILMEQESHEVNFLESQIAL